MSKWKIAILSGVVAGTVLVCLGAMFGLASIVGPLSDASFNVRGSLLVLAFLMLCVAGLGAGFLAVLGRLIVNQVNGETKKEASTIPDSQLVEQTT